MAALNEYLCTVEIEAFLAVLDANDPVDADALLDEDDLEVFFIEQTPNPLNRAAGSGDQSSST